MKNFEKTISKSVSAMSGYLPGEQPSQGGWVKLNTNEFPYPPSPKVSKALVKAAREYAKLRLYPDPLSAALRAKIAEYFGLPAGFAMACNGSDDALNIVVRAFSDSARKIASINPSYSLYPVLAKIQGAKLVEYPFARNASGGFEIPFEKIFKSGANIFFFTNPNAPTGVGFGKNVVEKILKKFGGLVLVDEAYAPFAGWSAASLVEKYDNLIVTGTMSKGWGLAGIRVGWVLANPKIIEVLDRVRDSYNLDRLSQQAALAALDDDRYYAPLREKVVAERLNTRDFLLGLGWNAPESASNFILFEPKNADGESGADVAEDLFEFLKGKKVLLRYFPKEKLVNKSIRLTIGTPEQMAVFRKGVLAWLKKGAK